MTPPSEDQERAREFICPGADAAMQFLTYLVWSGILLLPLTALFGLILVISA